MATYYHDPGAVKRQSLAQIARNTAYVVGDKVYVTLTISNPYHLECSIAGTTAVGAPAYSAIYNGTTVDGTATWVTKGTGDAATPSDRCWHIEDTLYTTSDSINTYAANQIYKFNYGTYTRADQDMHSANASRLVFATYDPVNAIDDWTKKVIIDCAAVTGAKKGIYINSNMQTFVGFSVKNGPNDGFYTGTGTHLFQACESINNAGYGFRDASSTPVAKFLSCLASGNGGIGFAGGMAFRCAAINNTGLDFSASYMDVLDCIIVRATASATATAKTFISNTVVQTTPNNDATARIAVASGASMGSFVVADNIFSGLKNTGSGVTTVVSAGSNTAAIVGNSVFYDCETPVGGTVAFNQDAGSYNTTNPSFTSATDLTPTADLTGIAQPETVWTEVNWIIPGAIQPAGAGASGGVSRGRLINSGGF